MNFKIADFNISISSNTIYKYNKLSKYTSVFEKADIEINYDENDIKREKSISTIKNAEIWNYKYGMIYRKLAELLPFHSTFVLHSATFDVDGVGVAFAAHSGTGKTTHMNLWQQLLGEKMIVVNGDKPIVRFFEDEPNIPYAYGTPWNGKEGLGCNMRTPLKHICFIERSETNYVEKMNKSDAINRIFNQIYMPKDPVAVMKTMELINRLLSCCELWIIHCNMESEAAEVAYNTIFSQHSP